MFASKIFFLMFGLTPTLLICRFVPRTRHYRKISTPAYPKSGSTANMSRSTEASKPGFSLLICSWAQCQGYHTGVLLLLIPHLLLVFYCQSESLTQIRLIISKPPPTTTTTTTATATTTTTMKTYRMITNSNVYITDTENKSNQ